MAGTVDNWSYRFESSTRPRWLDYNADFSGVVPRAVVHFVKQSDLDRCIAAGEFPIALAVKEMIGASASVRSMVGVYFARAIEVRPGPFGPTRSLVVDLLGRRKAP
jgi:hypothetical protein